MNILLFLLAVVSCSGCGVIVPKLSYSNDEKAPAYIVNKIVGHVKCELRSALAEVIAEDEKDADKNFNGERRLAWLDEWAAKVTLKLIVSENSALSPGATYKKPLRNAARGLSDGTRFVIGQNFSLGAGGSYTTEAIRTETVNFSFLVKQDLLDERVQFINRPKDCGYDGVYFNGDLGIQEWLHMATLSYTLPQYINSAPPDTLTHQVSFVITYSANVNPTWNLIDVTVNASNNPLFSTGRKRTNEVTVTLGPADAKFRGPSQQVSDENFLARLESAFSKSQNP